MHNFIAILVIKWSSSPVKSAVNFKIFPFHLCHFFPQKVQESRSLRTHQKNHKEQKMEITQKDKVPFSFSSFFQWDVASG